MLFRIHARLEGTLIYLLLLPAVNKMLNTETTSHDRDLAVIFL